MRGTYLSAKLSENPLTSFIIIISARVWTWLLSPETPANSSLGPSQARHTDHIPGCWREYQNGALMCLVERWKAADFWENGDWPRPACSVYCILLYIYDLKYLERSSHFLNLLRQSHIADGLICRPTTQMGLYADFSVPRNIKSFNSMLVSCVDTLCSCGSIVLDCNKKGLFPKRERRHRTTRWLAFMSYNGAFSVLSPVWRKVYVCKP